MSTTEITIPCENREAFGTRAARALRRAGKVPAVLYGRGQDTVHLALEHAAAQRVLFGHAHMVELTMDGTTQPALVQSAMFDVSAENVIHVDLLRVAADEDVEVEVEVKLIGTSKGEKDGGTVDHAMHTVAVRCLPGAIPDLIALPVEELEMGAVIHASDLLMPEGVTLVTDPEAGVLAIKHPVAEEEPVAVEEAETAEPELIKPERAGDAEGGQ